MGWDVHRVDVAHENVAEEIVEIARGAVERWSKGVDADGILISAVLLGDPHRRRQFHRVERVRNVPTPQRGAAIIIIISIIKETKRKARRTQT